MSAQPRPTARTRAATGRTAPRTDEVLGPRAEPEPEAGPRSAGPLTRLLGAPGVVGLALVAALAVLTGAAAVGGAAAPLSIGDPGPVTRWGLLVSRTAYDVAGIGTLGVLLVAVVLLPRVGDGFGPHAERLVRLAAPWSAAWAALAVTTMLLTLSDVAGRPVPAILDPGVLPLVLTLETTRSLLSSAWLAVLVAVGARLTRSPATGLLLLLTAVGAMVLPLLTGHAGHGELPAVTAASLALHVVAAAAWVGGLAALVIHLRGSHTVLAVAVPRFSRLALVCFGLVGASGAVTGWASLDDVGDLWTSPYGRLLLGKLLALVVLGMAGQLHRRYTVAAAVARRPWAFVRLAAGELVLMACAAALAVALSHTAPPAEPGHAPPAASAAAAAVG